ncbi:LPXTG cell wall anchor domain-containing protein [Streptomyces sp. NPDC048659]|uniref:LPXTG cell wall anchor domain-containing protein n=1 Tax=Streptomyces sp. NPDC048659 TaxID=3155489 RepID=UPI0034363500
MKIRRILATAVAAAVTTPVVLLSAAPAFADTKPSTTQDTKQDKGPAPRADSAKIEGLRLAVAKAQAEYDKTVVAAADAQRAMDDFEKPGNPLSVALDNAKKAAELAAEAKTAADEELKKAEKALAELPEDASDADKAAAEKAVTDARTLADEAKTTSETKAAAQAAARKAFDDARVDLLRRIGEADKAKAAALKALDAVKAALKEALEEEELPECEGDKNVAAGLVGPAKVKAGTSAVYTLTVINKSKTVTFEEVGAGAALYSLIDGQDQYLHLAWSSVDSPKWTPVDDFTDISAVTSVKPGKSYDFKLKVTVDAKAAAGEASLDGDVGYFNEDGSCGSTWDGGTAMIPIDILKADKPAPGKDSDKGGTTGGNGNTSEQGGSSKTPVTNGSGTGGTLAKTGSSDSTVPFALAGGAAVVLGAGAMVVARRRKAGADA